MMAWPGCCALCDGDGFIVLQDDEADQADARTQTCFLCDGSGRALAEPFDPRMKPPPAWIYFLGMFALVLVGAAAVLLWEIFF